MRKLKEELNEISVEIKTAIKEGNNQDLSKAIDLIVKKIDEIIESLKK